MVEPALPDLDEDEPMDEIPEPPLPPAPEPVPEPVSEKRMALPPVGGYGPGKPWEPGSDDAAGWERHRLLSECLEQMAERQGGSPPRMFVSEDVVEALEAGNPDEAFLLAGGQAWELLRSFVNPDPAARRGAIADMTEDFEQLARLLGSDAGDLPDAEIRRRLGLQGAWRKPVGTCCRRSCPV